VVRGHAFPALVPLPLGQRQVDDGVGQQERGRRDLLDQQPLGAVDRQHALRVVHEVVNSRVPVVEGETDQHVQVRFQHLVAADESTNLVNSASVGSSTVMSTQDNARSGCSVPNRRTSFHSERTLQMSMQSNTSSNDIQNTPSEPPCGIKLSRSSSVHSSESSDQSPAKMKAWRGRSPFRWYSSSSTFMLPPPQLAPIRNFTSRELSSWAQIRSRSRSSSLGSGSELACSGMLSHGAPRGKALDRPARHERLVAAVYLCDRLLDQRHPELFPLRLGVDEVTALVARQQIVHKHRRPAAVLAQLHLISFVNSTSFTRSSRSASTASALSSQQLPSTPWQMSDGSGVRKTAHGGAVDWLPPSHRISCGRRHWATGLHSMLDDGW
uniref:Uncharacterized protein n=1 Tax=Anopheles melas TaxID=34690 RepID=A0A182UGT0_9DIPT